MVTAPPRKIVSLIHITRRKLAPSLVQLKVNAPWKRTGSTINPFQYQRPQHIVVNPFQLVEIAVQTGLEILPAVPELPLVVKLPRPPPMIPALHMTIIGSLVLSCLWPAL